MLLSNSTLGDDLTDAGAARYHVFIVSILSFLAVAAEFLAWYPGVFTHDSIDQYIEASSGVFYEWHPPVMAFVWHHLLKITPFGTGLFTFHNVVYGFAGWLCSLTMLRPRRPVFAYATLAVFYLPPFFVMNAFIWKDVGMAATLLAAFSILFYLKDREKRPSVMLVAAALLVAYGILVRANAGFAAAPLVLLLATRRAPPLGLKQVIVAFVIVGASIPLSVAFNKAVIRSNGGGLALKSLTLFDQVGIAHTARDPAGFVAPVPLDIVDACYTPKWWDPINEDPCRETILQPSKGVVPWLKAIAHHPIAYARHRLLHFNEALFFLTARNDYVYGETALTARFPDLPAPSLGETAKSLHARMQNAVALSPALCFALALALLPALRFCSGRDDGAFVFGQYLALSSVLYFLSFLVVGVANMYRYQYYPMAATLICLVIFLAHADWRRRSTHIGAGAIAGTALVTAALVAIARATLSG